MKFKKGYLKNLKTEEEFTKAFQEAINDNLNVSSAMAAYNVAKKKGFDLKIAHDILGI